MIVRSRIGLLLYLLAAVGAGWAAEAPVGTTAYERAAEVLVRFGRWCSENQARGAGPYIVLAPASFSNTNALNDTLYQRWYPMSVINPMRPRNPAVRSKYDVEGTLALLKMLREQFGGEARIYVTGVSGGGIPCYGMVHGEPTMIAAAAPTCANYNGPKPPVRSGSGGPILQLLGADDGYNDVVGDGPGLIHQNDWAMREFQRRGFSVTREMVPGAGHGPMPRRVVEFFEKVRTEEGARPGP